MKSFSFQLPLILGKCEPLAASLRHLLMDNVPFAQVMRFMEGHDFLCIILVVRIMHMIVFNRLHIESFSMVRNLIVPPKIKD